MKLTFTDPTEADAKIPPETVIHNVSSVSIDSREVQATVRRITICVARVEHYGTNNRYVRYVIHDNGWFALFQMHPKYSRMSYAGMKVEV